MKRRFAAFLLIALLALTGRAGAQEAKEAPDAPPDPAFQDLVVAADLLRNSKAFQAAEANQSATLTQKRDALADKSVGDALRRLHDWLNKPVVLTKELDFADTSLFPVVGGAREVARALAMREYVQFADGRVGDAMDTTRDGLRLAYAVSGHSTLSWLVGNAVSAIVTFELARHFDQLSERDCDRLYQLAKEWLKTASPLPGVLERERKTALNELQKMSGKSGKEIVGTYRQRAAGGEEEPDDETKAQIAQVVALDAPAIQQMIDRAVAQVNKSYAEATADLEKPYWKHHAPETPDKTSPKAESGPVFVEALTETMTMALTTISETMMERQARITAQARLLGCHALIRRYKWEHNRWPGALADLNPGDLATDPYNGEPFVYKPSEASYVLESVGPLATDEDGKPIPGVHKPVRLAPERRPAQP